MWALVRNFVWNLKNPLIILLVLGYLYCSCWICILQRIESANFANKQNWQRRCSNLDSNYTCHWGRGPIWDLCWILSNPASPAESTSKADPWFCLGSVPFFCQVVLWASSFRHIMNKPCFLPTLALLSNRLLFVPCSKWNCYCYSWLDVAVRNNW